MSNLKLLMKAILQSDILGVSALARYDRNIVASSVFVLWGYFSQNYSWVQESVLFLKRFHYWKKH